MSSSKNLDNSVAFVDVITNGLGGMLVLFFVVVVVQSSLEWQASESHRKSDTKTLPFVVVVRSEDGRACFSPDVDVWSIRGVPARLVSDTRGQEKDWGPSHALLVVAEPLDVTRARLSVRTANNYASPLTVEVYPAGAAPEIYQVPAVAGRPTEVWPLLGKQSRSPTE